MFPNSESRPLAIAWPCSRSATVAVQKAYTMVNCTLEFGLIKCVGGCGQMYEAIIVSPQFTKKTTLARHRLVNSVLKQEIAAIHAWTPKCHTPEEWEKKKPQT